MPPPPVESPLEAISNTPIIRLRNVVLADHVAVYNDRTAIPVVEEAERRRDPKPRMTVMEATGRSIGTSLAFVCAAKGYPFRIASSSAFAREKLRSISAFGAIVYIIRSPPPS
ncbi:Pyridoxal phosphate-dependent enzyme beta subunit [Botryosphaeria dothidea]|uniref:Pyridoxal phosphate-dependent enzyme beta subunit n=1 Tax=Botryosphaeria dothidea TaxID=55169 RepID=A0A8H4N6A8_9PEZI|nr:Pyridoxal phosphate-dependent enzyme beta subunit [Botryosphaeria dothidea]